MKKLLSLFFFLLSSVNLDSIIAQTQSPTPASPAPSLAQVESLVSSGKLDAALAVLDTLRRSSTNEPLINHFAAVIAYQKGDYVRAVQLLSLSVKQASPNSKQFRQAVHMLGMSHYFLGHIPEGIPFLEQARGWAADDTEIAYMLGVSYVQVRSIDKARASFAQLFGVAPGSAAAYLINAQMMIRLSFEELAEQELQKALEMDGRLPQANFLLGELAIYKARVETGIELMKKELAINPMNAMAYYRLGEALARQQKWDDSLAPLQKSIWLNPYFSGPFIVMGKAYLKKGDLTNAESILRRALKMDPNNAAGHLLLAQTLQQANRPDEARREFEAAERLRTESEK